MHVSAGYSVGQWWSNVDTLLLDKDGKHFYQAEETEVRLWLGERYSALG